MKQIKVKALSKDAFAPFGEYYAMDKPENLALCGPLHRFYPDRIIAAADHNLGFSAISVKKPEEYVITQQEYHTTTWEMILPLDDDMILHVAERSAGAVNNDTAQAFLVPKHTLVKIYAGVWHLAPLPATRDEIHCVIILPECTYANDCTVVDLTAEQQFTVVL